MILFQTKVTYKKTEKFDNCQVEEILGITILVLNVNPNLTRINPE